MITHQTRILQIVQANHSFQTKCGEEVSCSKFKQVSQFYNVTFSRPGLNDF